jgi:hypothetical protein
MERIQETKYCEGFAAATNMDVDQAAYQIAELHHPVKDWNSYDEGYAEGDEFLKTFEEE